MIFQIHTYPSLLRCCELVICYLTHNGEMVVIQNNLHLGSPKEPNWICSECDVDKTTNGKYLKGTNHKGYDTLMDAVNDVKKYFGLHS